MNKQKVFVITYGDNNTKTQELNELLSKNWWVKSVHQGAPAGNTAYWLVVTEELPAK